jgi:periplasmic copper chaperone A
VGIVQLIRRAFILLPLFATAAQAHSYKQGDIKVGHAWALPGLAGQDGQCFMPILNSGGAADALVAARSDVCKFIELRRNARYDDPAEKQIDVLPNAPVPMRPSAMHLRLIGLTREIKNGDRFGLILDFLNQGEIEVEVFVEDEGGH